MPNSLTNKSYKIYNYLSRYTTFPYYYHKIDKKNIYGVTNQLKEDTLYDMYRTKKGDTLDDLALMAYNDPCKFWIIADFNHIQDPFVVFEANELIKIPNLSTIEYRGLNG